MLVPLLESSSGLALVRFWQRILGSKWVSAVLGTGSGDFDFGDGYGYRSESGGVLGEGEEGAD